MYLIAVLCFMKIYQFRHADVTSNAYKVKHAYMLSHVHKAEIAETTYRSLKDKFRRSGVLT